MQEVEDFLEQDRKKEQARQAENQRLENKLIFAEDFELENPMVDVDQSKSFSQVNKPQE